MAKQGSIGTTIQIAAAVPATFDAAGYDAVQTAGLTKIGFVETVPEYGGTANIETFDDLETGVRDKAAGVFDYGSTALTVGIDRTDAGQILAKEGFDGTASRDTHTVIVTFPDGTRDAFTAIISSFTKNPGSAGPFIRGTVTFELKTSVLELAAYVAP